MNLYEFIVNVGKDTPVHWILLEACRWFPQTWDLFKGEASSFTTTKLMVVLIKVTRLK